MRPVPGLQPGPAALDGVDLCLIQTANADIDLPDLAVILTADADLITARLTAHHRFERDPGNVQRELDLYQEAARILAGLPLTVAHVDAGASGPDEVTAAIVHNSGLLSATVAPARSAPDPGHTP
ncbi:hypothetical protein Kisp01_67540 [Kineosporia sp. NBRC 101677]|uniref:hypothetical protein n=1 Tax=Kineosporia sp. NBRC 101677 TaxID=3032197 RepID=UPI0024A5CDA6|nr:hypothetical protein [Kineosporia sp. NBRC 101677]GLY19740.1 hypothetical protein Kisp01_67540 [Kineosporia sp. NBRC 101677]